MVAGPLTFNGAPAAAGDGASAVTDFSQYAGLRAAAKNNDPKALRHAAQQFEALFTEMLLKSSDQTKFGDDLTGQQGDFYKDLYNQQLASHLSSGKGLGLADMLLRQLNGVPPGSSSATPLKMLSLPSASATDSSPPAPSKSAQEFVDAIRPHAEKAAAELGIPARALIAQAALETGWGKHVAKHQDGSSGFNLFGIKAGAASSADATTQMTQEYENGQLTSQRAQFRAYSSIGASFEGYVQYLKSNPRYAEALRSGDVNGFVHGLQKAGYATDPQYAQKLLKIAYGTQMASAYGSGSRSRTTA